jgi:chromate transporter
VDRLEGAGAPGGTPGDREGAGPGADLPPERAGRGDASTPAPEPSIPRLSLAALFLRFLRFGSLAWGGPVAQIAMIQKELVEEERWIPVERFRRALAVYQVLPGPEAHELCVYFGMLARGRAGAIVAGLGFMLPGFLLMFVLGWAYMSFGLSSPAVVAASVGLQAAVVALIVRAVHRIGRHAIHGPWPWGLCLAAFAADFAGVHFAVTLAAAGGAFALASDGRRALPIGAAALLVAALLAWIPLIGPPAAEAAGNAAGAAPTSPLRLLASGLKGGLLTFGGAYTAIPVLRHDAVVSGGWMTNDQFLDGIALGGILPAPLIIFSTFVGYVGGGAVGALAMTAGIFLPAFAFTLMGHEQLERWTADPRLRGLLDGITAAVVGMIAATTCRLFRSGVQDMETLAIFGGALVALHVWTSKAAVPVVVLAAGFLGMAAYS